MVRPLRIVYEGAVYHVTIRGNNRCNVFKTDRDRERFITNLAERSNARSNGKKQCKKQ